MTPHKDYPDQDFAKLKYDCTQLLNWSDQSHLDTAPTSQVFDYTQQPSVTELKIQVVQCLSAVSCLQVIVTVSDRRNIYTYIPSEQILIAEIAPESITFSADVPLHLTCISYQCRHTHWLRGQPTYMAHNDLCLINVVVLDNNVSFGRE